MPATILGIAALVGAGAAIAQSAAPETAPRTVELELRENGRLVGAPTLSMAVGRPTAVTVGGTYSMRLRLDAEPDTDGDGEADLVLRSTLFRPGDNARVTAPAMPLIEGLPSRIRLAGVDGANLQLGVLVR